MENSNESKEEESIFSLLTSRWSQHIGIIEEKTGIPGKYIVFGLSLAAFFVFIGYF